MNRTIEFSFNADDLSAFAQLVASLNKAGVPFTLRRDSVAIAITIGTGY